MSIQDVLAELPALTVAERQMLVRRALDLDESGLTAEVESLVEDRLADHLDVIGLNEYFGWYEEGFEGLRQLLANSKPDRPVLISEVGADALAGHHGPDSELFTEERQAWVFENQIEAIRKIDWICGFFPWLLYDFRSPRRQTAIQNGINRKGLIAEDKTTQKLAFEVIARFYLSKTE